jgi:hypothetical protein
VKRVLNMSKQSQFRLSDSELEEQIQFIKMQLSKEIANCFDRENEEFD